MAEANEYFANRRAEENDATAAADTNVGHKPAKPRLAEVLGVEVNERFRIGDIGCNFWIEADGWPRSELFDRNASSKWVINAINHPERIIRAPRLTEAEMAICKAVGAKWVSRGAFGTKSVVLWDEKPECFDDGTFGSTDTAHKLVRMYTKFENIHPGECICVEEAGGDA